MDGCGHVFSVNMLDEKQRKKKLKSMKKIWIKFITQNNGDNRDLKVGYSAVHELDNNYTTTVLLHIYNNS